MTMNPVFSVFHLNLAYSSIPEDKRKTVIDQSYWPLLEIISQYSIPLGIEINAWSLQQISALDPQWLSQFRQLLHEGRCELIGSGYVQLIGPLVSRRINEINQSSGLRIYQDLLGIQPRLALVNEMAFVPALVDVYGQAGYHGIIMDRDNICLALGLENADISDMPRRAAGESRFNIPVLWSDSILFQKLQRYVHGEISLQEYQEYLSKRISSTTAPLPLYCNDAEIFGFRPNRYATEAAIHTEDEWARLTALFEVLNQQNYTDWLLPSEALKFYLTDNDDSTPVVLNSIKQPVPVKKQLKYNISRWAVSGRDDTWLNTICFRIANTLQEFESAQSRDIEKDWQQLCELWASDYRTHITESRWQLHIEKLTLLCEKLKVSMETQSTHVPSTAENDTTELDFSKSGFRIEQVSDALLTINTDTLQLVLNLRRGLTIKSLAFARHDFVPMLGTIPHGFFNTIELGADYYSNGTLIELYKDQRRITDLVPVKPALRLHDNTLEITALIATDLGPIVKQYRIYPDEGQVTAKISFPAWKRPYAVIRTGIITLLPEATGEGPVFMECDMAGIRPQRFLVNETCLHDRAASSLVSSSTGLVSTAGEIIIGSTSGGNSDRALKVNWDPALCAVFPMLHHQQRSPASLTRLIFSLSEVDETFVAGGHVPDFEFSVTPI